MWVMDLCQPIRCEQDWIYLLQQEALMETPSLVLLCLSPDLLRCTRQLYPLAWYFPGGNGNSLGLQTELKQAVNSPLYLYVLKEKSLALSISTGNFGLELLIKST